MLAVFRRFGSIQFDPIAVAGRNHDLVLHARVAGHEPSWCEVLFDFDHVWEGFFPPARRRWGRYVLPISFGDRFVGRIEPRIDRDRAAVEVLGVWWEEGFEHRRVEGFVDAMRDALCAYVRFAGADRLEWPAHLGTERRLFGEPAGRP